MNKFRFPRRTVLTDGHGRVYQHTPYHDPRFLAAINKLKRTSQDKPEDPEIKRAKGSPEDKAKDVSEAEESRKSLHESDIMIYDGSNEHCTQPGNEVEPKDQEPAEYELRAQEDLDETDNETTLPPDDHQNSASHCVDCDSDDESGDEKDDEKGMIQEIHDVYDNMGKYLNSLDSVQFLKMDMKELKHQCFAATNDFVRLIETKTSQAIQQENERIAAEYAKQTAILSQKSVLTCIKCKKPIITGYEKLACEHNMCHGCCVQSAVSVNGKVVFICSMCNK